MFLALRDLRFARGRFALMGAVVALITLMVVLLSGLTAGLADQSVSAVRDLPADRLAFAPPVDGGPSFGESRLDDATVRAWTDGRAGATPLGVATTRVDSAGRSVATAAFGVAPDGMLAPSSLEEGVVLPEELARETGAAVGDTVQVGGRPFVVEAVSGDASYNHLPVAWIPIADWRTLDAAAGASATVVALAEGTGDPEGALVVPRADSLAAVGSYSAENGSLRLMQAMLLAISALVIGAFFTVWTVQRRPEVALLKAVGATDGYLLRDALSQAMATLLAGGALGLMVAIGVGLGAARSVPFVIAPATTLLPVALMLALGALGAALAVRRITAVDPLTAMGATR